MARIECIANNGDNGEPEVPLWECPCAECTALDWEALDDDTQASYGSLRNYRYTNWPQWSDGRPNAGQLSSSPFD